MPYVAQRWCDAAAPKEANNSHDPRHISVHDSRFVLTDSQGYTVQGGWKAAITTAGEALMAAQMGKDTSTPTRGEVLWHRLRHLFFGSEWDGLALIGKTSAAAALRLNAEADTITDPAGDRWTTEQAARDAGTLEELQRPCLDCGKIYYGGWDTHRVNHCEATKHLWAAADLSLLKAWAQEVAWDFPDAWRLFRGYRTIWQRLTDGGTWHGFKLTDRSIGSAPTATGLAATDAEGSPDVLPPGQVHKAAATWAKNNPEKSDDKKTGGKWEQLIPVLQSIRDHKVTLVPGKLFELHQQWQGPAADFEQSLLSRLRTERKLHAQACAAGGFDDFWAWWGGFVGWCRRHFGSLIEGFTGILNRTGPLHAGFTITEEDQIWGLAYDAWEMDGRPRIWNSDGMAGAFIGNPPYSWPEIRKFCSRAQRSKGPILGILPTSLGTQRRTGSILKRTGGTTLGVFRTGTCAFIPQGFWTGSTSRGTAANRRLRGGIVIAGWRIPEIKQAALLELATVAQAASNSSRPPFSRGKWKTATDTIARAPDTQDREVDEGAQPGWSARQAQRAKRLAAARARLSQTKRQARDKAVAKARRQREAPIMSSAPMLDGPWTDLRWWRQPTAWRPPLNTTEAATWTRMAAWGMIPQEFHELLRFVGVTKEARQRISNRISKAVRHAATDSIFYARRAHKNRPQEPQAAKEPAPSQPRHAPPAIPNDRGLWEGPAGGNAKLRDTQERQHQASLAPA